jgi:Protein of unknown function (DUF2934)
VRKTLLIHDVCEAYSFGDAFTRHLQQQPHRRSFAKREPLTKEVMVMAKSAQRQTDDPVATAADRAPRARIDAATDISEHDIARRAYDLYLTRGSEPGHDVEDWLQAEHELRSRSAAITV